MGCFGVKKYPPKNTKLVSFQSSDSTTVDPDFNRSGSELNSLTVSDTSTESSNRNTFSFSSMSQRASNLRVFTFQEVKSATKAFSRSGRLGEGGFGCVYKGVIKSLEDPPIKQDVAIKQLGKRGLQARIYVINSYRDQDVGHKEWVTEVNLLGVIEHPNLVKLLGYCADDDERGIQRLLVYEYMPNGSVEDHLSPRSRTVLSWPMRLKIAQDAARGLVYLHEEMDFQVIFRDFKSSNILLDDQWKAKLSDFGFARFGPLEGESHVTTAVVGTFGYAAPEYIRTGRLTAKSDVWSYGVFLYELITGRRPIDKNLPKSEQKLLQWVKPYLSNKKKFELIVDPRLGKKYPIKYVHKLSIIANRCLTSHHKARPKMSEVLQMVTELVDSTDMGDPEVLLRNPGFVGEDPTEKNGKRRRFVELMSGENGCFSRIWGPKIVRIC
ncbi:hypothetical protein V2J09_010604 [Rumex salicifolius]